MPPVMIGVHSTHVDAVGHDPATSELWVRWDNGKTSIYSGVSADLAEEVRSAWSVGEALRTRVKPFHGHRYA